MDIWSSYWKAPRLACTLAGGGIGYPHAVTAVWREFFTTLEDGARLLDIGTGNGAIAILANDTARSLGRRFEIHASDSSAIDPPVALRGTGVDLGGIYFHSGVPTEKSGFPDGYFDAVTGQFALEYSDMPAAVAEIARILKLGGRARFVLHMRGSKVYMQTERQLEDMHFLLDDLRLLDKACAMMAATYASDAAGNPADSFASRAQESQREFFAAAKIAREAIPRVAYKELYADVLQVLAHQWNSRRHSTPQKFLARIAEMKAELCMTRKRHLAMCRSALNPAAIKALGERLLRSGFAAPRVAKWRLPGDDGYFAWLLATTRLDDARRR